VSATFTETSWFHALSPFVSATFMICVHDFPHWEVSMKVGVMELELCTTANDTQPASAPIEQQSKIHTANLLNNRDVVSVKTSRSQDVLTSHLSLVSDKILNVLVSDRCVSGSRLGLGAICLSLNSVGLGPLHLGETFCANARCACCSCS